MYVNSASYTSAPKQQQDYQDLLHWIIQLIDYCIYLFSIPLLYSYVWFSI